VALQDTKPEELVQHTLTLCHFESLCGDFRDGKVTVITCKTTGWILCYYGNFCVRYDNGLLINLIQNIYNFLFKIDINLSS
jgi:hypothetical protein